MSASLTDPLTLPCGATLRNRLAKAAITEGVADAGNRATARHATLYQRWAAGGLGLLLTGNILIDRRFLERPGNVAIDGNGGLDALRAYAAAATIDGTHCWVQINHPGRQAGVTPGYHVAPSAAADAGVRALDDADIRDIIRRFVHVATVAREAGFTGVQIHAAHGYLLSQFLSPRTNLRTDEWGGPLANRARLLLEIVRAVRDAVGHDFPVAVKLNSADFQRGGLTESDSAQVAQWLNAAGIDLLEISGGNYQSQEMVGSSNGDAPMTKSASTLRREAYFLAFAELLRPIVSVPLMVTGGFRSAAAMRAALASGAADVIGIARPLCLDPALAAGLLRGDDLVLPSPDVCGTADTQSAIAFYFNRIRDLADGAPAAFETSDWLREQRLHEAHDAEAEARYRADIAASTG